MTDIIKDELKILRKEAQKQSKKIAIAITVTTQKFNSEIKVFPVRYTDDVVCLPIGIKNDKIAIKIIKKYDKFVDMFFVDSENKIQECQDLLKKIQQVKTKNYVYPIKGNDFSADATYAIIVTIFKNLSKKNFCIVGAGNIGSKVALKLIELGANVFVLNSNFKSSKNTAYAINTLKPKECSQIASPISLSKIPNNLDGVIGFTRGIPAITTKFIKKVKKDGIIFDGGTGTITHEAIKLAKEKKLKVLKLDIRIGFESNVILMTNAKKFVSEVLGIRKMNGFNIISGGYVGDYGDIVVDNFKKPKKIIGVADGKGGLVDGSIIKKFKIIKNNVVMKN